MVTKKTSGVTNRMNEFIAGAKTGDFLAKVSTHWSDNRGAREEIALEIAALQNEGLVDVVGAFESLKSKSSGGPDFFSTRHVFEKALPHINAPVTDVMRCVLRLYRDAGQDGAAGMIFDSFIEFCAKDEARPREALALIEANPDEYSVMITAVLIAGSRIDNSHYLVEAIRLTNNPNIDIRRQAAFSIGKIDQPGLTAILDSTYSALEEMFRAEFDDQILAGILKSTFALWQKDKTFEPRAFALIDRSLTEGTDHTLHAASELFGFFTKELSPELLNIILPALIRVKPENKGTLDIIDLGIDHLLSSQEHYALDFLEQLLLTHQDKLSLSSFDSVIHTIVQSPPLMGRLATRWLLKGDRALCDGLCQITQVLQGSELTVVIDSSELVPKDHVHILFLARKAVGYLLTAPTMAASIIVSLMRETTDGETLEALKTLLLDPILLNSPGIAESYLRDEAKKNEGPAEAVIADAIKMMDAYFETLHAIGPVPELHPSEEQREAHRRRFGRQVAESFKEAEKRSVFLSIFPKSVLLYGRKSIDRVYEPSGESRRIETPLESHSMSFEYPRMVDIDPVGLDYMTRVFRVERFKK